MNSRASRGNGVALAAAIMAAFWLWRGRSSINPGIDVYYPDEPWHPAPDDWGNNTVNARRNLGAFLYMLQAAETGQRNADSGDSYHIFYGGSRFEDLSDHPVTTGAKAGVRLSDSMCRAAGLGPGCVSTAAGAYQFIRPTWERMRQAGSWGDYLPDFSVESQDEAARRQLIELGILTMVQAGDFGPSLNAASRVWASLPGSTAQQNPKRYDEVFSYYSDALASSQHLG